MKIETVPIGSVRPHPKNMRLHDETNLEFIAKSLQAHGQQKPIVVDAKGQVLAGNGTLAAAQKLGWKQIQVVRSGLSGTAALDYMIRDNRATDLSEFDPEGLERALREVEDRDPSVIETMVFDDMELRRFGLEAPREQDDVVPPAPAIAASRVGATYILGDHRLACGDSRDEGLLDRALSGHLPNMMFTDPPYGVSLADKNNRLNELDRSASVQDAIAGDHLEWGELRDLWICVFRNCFRNVNRSFSYYICGGGYRGLVQVTASALENAGMPYKHLLIWAKNQHVLGRCDYHYKHELIFYGWGETHRFYRKGEQQASVWEYDKPRACVEHPTMKPVALCENGILNSSLPGEIVLDPFLGSGSTLIAAERTKRKCVGIELEPKYCDVIRRRWAEFVHGEGCNWKALTPEDGAKRRPQPRRKA